MRPGQGLLPPSPPKGGYGDGENDRSGVGKRRRRIVLMQRKFGKLGNLGRMTGYIHGAELIKSGRVQNLGVSRRRGLINRVGCTLTYSRRGRR